MYNNSIYWGKTYLAYLTYNIVHNTKRALLLRTPPGQYHAGVILASIVTGLAGLECAFFLMTLAVFSINLHNHRKAGIQRCMASVDHKLARWLRPRKLSRSERWLGTETKWTYPYNKLGITA